MWSHWLRFLSFQHFGLRPLVVKVWIKGCNLHFAPSLLFHPISLEDVGLSDKQLSTFLAVNIFRTA